MSLGPVRPRFHMRIAGPAAVHQTRLEAAVAQPDSQCVSRTLRDHIDITVKRDIRHRWSPCVQLEFQHEPESDTTVIHGLIGPHPDTWTLFAFINITLICIIAFGGLFGFAQLSQGWPAWGLGAVPAGLMGLAVMYGLSQIGRKCAAEQTHLLMNLIERALGPSLEVTPSRSLVPNKSD